MFQLRGRRLRSPVALPFSLRGRERAELRHLLARIWRIRNLVTAGGKLENDQKYSAEKAEPPPMASLCIKEKIVSQHSAKPSQTRRAKPSRNRDETELNRRETIRETLLSRPART